MQETRNLVTYSHCDQLVSRSTTNRHENKRKNPRVLRKLYQNIVVESQSSDSNDCDTKAECSGIRATIIHFNHFNQFSLPCLLKV